MFRLSGVWVVRDGCWCPGSVFILSTWSSWSVKTSSNNIRLENLKLLQNILNPNWDNWLKLLLWWPVIEDNVSGLCQCWHVHGPHTATWGRTTGNNSFPSSQVIIAATSSLHNLQQHLLFQVTWVDSSRYSCCYFLPLVGSPVSTEVTGQLKSWLFLTLSRSRFIELGKAEKSEEDQCCPMKLKTGKGRGGRR